MPKLKSSTAANALVGIWTLAIGAKETPQAMVWLPLLALKTID